MTDSTVLDEAESRLGPSAATAQATRTQTIEAIRVEIGAKHYDQAKAQLPELERAIQKIYRPFLDRVTTIAAKGKAPLPTQVNNWLNEMDVLCTNVPNQIRRGIDGWEQMTAPLLKDGKAVDLNERARLIYHIRVCLRSWDGVAIRLTDLKALTANFIGKSGWPTSAA